MKTIKLTLPDPAIAYIKSIQKKEEIFAKEAVEEKIARGHRTNLKDLLKEGYQATAKEDLEISNDFQFADSGLL
ncbi:hypothetical protein [Dyadobacter pollutisoli]|uniref:Uncharacterized protein n=1 Tax=Dyadobacter pollutisoli TaxID=2910158 RepID=A0A9E8NGA7_9BACT|nr:hypothetical protein [Dyadobacter pollutisoli]WAC13737.1 hypothetical protein ON006_07205 [Dyadobacter pollutisoli]